MDYLRWYRRMLDVPVENGIELIDLGGDDGLVLLTLAGPATREVAARRVVLANGRDGLGGPLRPALSRARPRAGRTRSDDIDFAALAAAVGVIGAGATAWTAPRRARAGAAQVAMLVRRADLPRINKGKGIGNPGFVAGLLQPHRRLEVGIRHYINDQQVPPPRNSMLRCSRQKNFSILPRCAVRAAAVRDGRVLLDTTRGRLAFDRVILATGLSVDWDQRPEFVALKPHVQLWRDHFYPDGTADYAQAEHPYLGAHFEFLPRGHAPDWVNRIHCFNYAATIVTADLRRYPGDQPRSGARRARRRKRPVHRRLPAHVAAARRLEQSGVTRRRVCAG